MAGLEEPAHAQHAVATTAEQHKPSPRRPLPEGPCNYRDQTLGPCRCNQFWDKYSAELHEGSTHHRPSSERSTWCVCSHHACFHLPEARPATAQPPAQASPVHHRVPELCDSRCQPQPGSQCSHGRAISIQGVHALHNARLRVSRAGSSERLMRQGTPSVNGALPVSESRERLSQLSPSGLPRVPSVCLLSKDRFPRTDTGSASRQARTDTSRVDHHIAGLGFTLVNPPDDRRPSVSSTVADDINRVGSFSEPEVPATRANSHLAESGHITTPQRGAPSSLDQVLEFNRTLQVNVPGDTIPDTFNPDDFIQSATEVATPSEANTPNLAPLDHAVTETKLLVNTLTRLTANAQPGNGQSPRPPASVTSASAVAPPSVSPRMPSHDQLQQAIRSASPQVLQNLVSYLNPLHNLLNSIPNLTTSMREITNRLDHLENYSFNHVQLEDFQPQFEMYEGRLLELEHRMDDHEAFHQAIDADQSSNSFSRSAVGNANTSFDSNQSALSITSFSDMRQAPAVSHEVQAEFEGIKERLNVLEASAMPSMGNPWEVEVVLLPWGPELRGIWYAPDEPMHESNKSVTQESEDWTQGPHMARLGRGSQGSANRPNSSSGRSGKLSLTNSLALSESGSGWSSQAISNWAAGDVDEWLFPKACGKNNLVYKRLKSRGFVKNVFLTGASSRDIQTALAHAFGDLTEHLKIAEEHTDPTIDSFPGLRAPFIPLRKVLNQSKLRFLTRAEMSSSALWSAQFLSAGVIMRVSGGKKRLYVTQREAYLQENSIGQLLNVGETGKSWTWQDIRELPRFQPDMDSQMEGNDEQCLPKVSEADAKEACWAFVETIDLPPVSVTSSFSSHLSAPVELLMRPADRQWRRSITPSSILKNKPPQPISPLSEFHPRRPILHHARTASTSVVELPQSASKRRMESSPIKHSRTPSTAVSIPKRRRVGPSSCPPLDVDDMPLEQAQLVLWNGPAERPQEPPSPFYSSQRQMARTSSDLTSRSQRSVVYARKATPSAYATPYSGPVGVTGGFGPFSDGPGDTEPDDDLEEDDDDDDGEQSWRGVGDEDDHGNNDSDGDSDSSASGEDGRDGLEEPGSFSGDGSDFGSENEQDSSDDGDGDHEFDFGAQYRDGDEDDDDDEEEDEVFDTLLGVLEH